MGRNSVTAPRESQEGQEGLNNFNLSSGTIDDRYDSLAGIINVSSFLFEIEIDNQLTSSPPVAETSINQTNMTMEFKTEFLNCIPTFSGNLATNLTNCNILLEHVKAS